MKLAGADSRLLDEGLSERDLSGLLEANTLVMHADPSDSSQVMTQAGQEWVKAVMDTLKRSAINRSFPLRPTQTGLGAVNEQPQFGKPHSN